MSWDSYIDNMKAQSAGSDGKQHLSGGAIVGLDGSVWTQKDITINPAEIKVIVDGFNNPASFQANGVNVGGVKYMYLQSDTSQIQAKKKDQGGISIAKATKCVVIGKYAEGSQPGNCRKAVDTIRDYLVGSSF